MDREPFEKLDQDFMEKLRSEREKAVAPEMLKGFSASVEAKIAIKEKKPSGARLIIPVLVPVFATLLLASMIVFKNPSLPLATPTPHMGMILTGTADLFDEISALEELGVWGEDDQEILGVSDLEAAPE